MKERELKEYQQLKWNIDLYTWIEIGGRMLVSIMSFIAISTNITKTSNNIIILSYITMGILILWATKPLISEMKLVRYYEEERKKERNNK